MAKTLKASTRKASRKVAARKIENPFVRTYGEETSKSAILFERLATKRGATLEDLANETGSEISTIRVRLSQLRKNFEIENIGERGAAVYRLVA